MKICEDCIKQDVCKFKESIEAYEDGRAELPKPLVPEVRCKFKQTTTGRHYTAIPSTTYTATSDPSWTTGDDPLAPQVSWC